MSSITVLHFDNHISVNMRSPNRRPSKKQKVPTQERRCGGCGNVGHDRRTCPLQPGDGPLRPAQNRTVRQSGVAEAPEVPPIVETAVQDASTVNWDNILYVVFDLETTGRSSQHNEIIEISAQFLDPAGGWCF